jgi:ketosteroid isomerase-like protein
MPRGNVELMKEGIEAFNGHDPETLDAMCHPEVELVTLRGALEGTVYRGPGAFTDAFREFDESWEGLRYDVDEVRESGDVVVTLGVLRGTGLGSGVEVASPSAIVVRYEDGLIRSFRTYADRSAVLEAAGVG